MRYDSCQFGSFDGLDNRKEVLILFQRLGKGLPDVVGDALRAGFLQGLLAASTTGFAGKLMTVDPCSALEAYNLFIAITGCLGVPVERAAVALDDAVQKRDDFLMGVLADDGCSALRCPR